MRWDELPESVRLIEHAHHIMKLVFESRSILMNAANASALDREIVVRELEKIESAAGFIAKFVDSSGIDGAKH